MKLPDELRSELEKELRYISDRILAEDDLRRKVFFYSGSLTAVRRITSVYYDPQLVLMDMVLEVSCNTISDRIESIIKDNDTTISLIDGFFEKLAKAVQDLADCVKSNEDTYEILEKIASLAHSTTGIGYYLYAKGIAKI